MSAITRLRSAGLGRRSRTEEPAAVVPLAIIVLGPLAAAGPVGCALALRLAAAAEVDCALVVSLGPVAGPRAPARRGAARLATALVSRGVCAVATGRLVRTDVTDAGGLPAFDRVAAAGPGPAVLLAGPVRTDAVDALLPDLDGVVLAPAAGTDPDVAALAAEALCALGQQATVAAGAPDLISRTLALAGLAAIGPPRATADAVLEGWR
ncbi:MAG TPA: hypothetical protein VGI54_10300 [Solirubrobacteraceae bacterium]